MHRRLIIAVTDNYSCFQFISIGTDWQILCVLLFSDSSLITYALDTEMNHLNYFEYQQYMSYFKRQIPSTKCTYQWSFIAYAFCSLKDVLKIGVVLVFTFLPWLSLRQENYFFAILIFSSCQYQTVFLGKIL